MSEFKVPVLREDVSISEACGVSLERMEDLRLSSTMDVVEFIEKNEDDNINVTPIVNIFLKNCQNDLEVIYMSIIAGQFIKSIT